MSPVSPVQRVKIPLLKNLTQVSSDDMSMSDVEVAPDVEVTEDITRVLPVFKGALAVIEPMFSLAIAAEWIPLRLEALKWLLRARRDEFPPRYHTMMRDGVGGKVRMLTQSEVLRIRDMVINSGGRRPVSEKRKAKILDLQIGAACEVEPPTSDSP